MYIEYIWHMNNKIYIIRGNQVFKQIHLYYVHISIKQVDNQGFEIKLYKLLSYIRMGYGPSEE